MFGIGMTELIVILVIALIVIGPSKLPEIAKALGKGLAEFKKASQEIKDSFNLEDEINDIKNDLKEGTIDSIGEYDSSAYEEKKDDPSEKKSDADETAVEEESEDDKTVAEGQSEDDKTPAEGQSGDDKKEPVVDE